jgi:hypothetical protein
MMKSSASRHFESMATPIAALPQIYSALVGMGSGAGFSESKWEEICRQQVEAECELCGIKVTGQELAELAKAKGGDTLTNPKLQRLRFHYCARNSCDCRFYRLNFLAHPEVDWGKLKGPLQDSIHLLPSDNEAKWAVWLQWNDKTIIGAVGGFVVATILLVLLHHWIYGGRIPLIQERHHYSAEPQPHLK